MGFFNFFKKPQNLGDIILGNASSDDPAIKKLTESIKQNLPKKKAEGVTDENIREFWNFTDSQRRKVILSESTFRLAVFSSAKEDGLTNDEASALVSKIFPMYGSLYDDPDNTKYTPSGDDRLLPNELRGRVDKYRLRLGAAYIKDKMKGYTTYNAYIRDEIRKGNL